MVDIKAEDLTKLTKDLLSKNKGVFIGNAGDMAPLFAASNLVELKKAGVTTVYVGYNMHKAMAAQAGDDCRKEFIGHYAANPIEDITVHPFQHVINAATVAGIRVIGHSPIVGTSEQHDRMEKDPELRKKLTGSGVAADKIDDFAAEVIKRTQDGGKYIVFDTASHSGNEIKDRPSGKGLSERLGIPSIDFKKDTPFFAPNTYGGVAIQKFKEMIGNKPSSLELTEVKNGESTYKVTAFTATSVYNHSAAKPTADDRKKAEMLAREIKDSGQCTIPKHLQGKEFLDAAEIDNLVSNVKKPQAQPVVRK